MTTDAQYAAATALFQTVVDKHPGNGRTPDDMFMLFQQCVAVVMGNWERASGRVITIETTCAACG